MSSTEGKKPEPLTIEEQGKVLYFAERVHTLSNKVLDLVLEDTKDLPGVERWAIMSRVLSGIFAHHFMISLNTAGGEMAKRDVPSGDPVQHAAPPPSEL